MILLGGSKRLLGRGSKYRWAAQGLTIEEKEIRFKMPVLQVSAKARICRALTLPAVAAYWPPVLRYLFVGVAALLSLPLFAAEPPSTPPTPPPTSTIYLSQDASA